MRNLGVLHAGSDDDRLHCNNNAAKTHVYSTGTSSSASTTTRTVPVRVAVLQVLYQHQPRHQDYGSTGTGTTSTVLLKKSLDKIHEMNKMKFSTNSSSVV